MSTVTPHVRYTVVDQDAYQDQKYAAANSGKIGGRSVIILKENIILLSFQVWTLHFHLGQLGIMKQIKVQVS